MSLDVLYLTWNRLEFTRVSLSTVFANTDWDEVDRLVVYDDGSEDGTAEFVAAAVQSADCPAADCVIRHARFRSPVAIMHDYLTRDPARFFAKIDNDIAVPPGWLPAMQASFKGGVDALGMAAGWTGVTDGPPGWEPATHIGGVGVIRTDRVDPAELYAAGRYGWTEYQHAHPRFRSGWVTPDVAAVELGKIPGNPWHDLSARYSARGWARWWPPYDQASHAWWDWVPLPEAVGA